MDILAPIPKGTTDRPPHLPRFWWEGCRGRGIQSNQPHKGKHGSKIRNYTAEKRKCREKTIRKGLQLAIQWKTIGPFVSFDEMPPPFWEPWNKEESFLFETKTEETKGRASRKAKAAIIHTHTNQRLESGSVLPVL